MTYSVSFFGAALDLLLAPKPSATSRQSFLDSHSVDPSPSALTPGGPKALATLDLS